MAELSDDSQDVDMELRQHMQYWDAQSFIADCTGKPTVKEYDTMCLAGTCTQARKQAVKEWDKPESFQVLNQWALQELLLQEETTHPDANAAVIYKYMEPGVVCDSQGVMYALRKLVLLNQRLNSLARPSPFEKRSCFCLPATHFMPNGCKHHKASPVTVRQPGQEPGQVPADHDKFITYFCEECTTCMRCHKYHGWN